MNNTDKSTINALYQDALNLLASVFMSSDKEAITKATAKVVAYQEIMNALRVPVGAPKTVKNTQVTAPVQAPVVSAVSQPVPKPATPANSNIEALIARGASPAEIFAAMEGKSAPKPQPKPQRQMPQKSGPVHLDEVFSADELARMNKF